MPCIKKKAFSLPLVGGCSCPQFTPLAFNNNNINNIYVYFVWPGTKVRS